MQGDRPNAGSARILENADQNNSEYGRFSRSVRDDPVNVFFLVFEFLSFLFSREENYNITWKLNYQE